MADVYSVLEALKSYGAPGVFLMALVANLIPGFPAIYLIVVVSLSVVSDDPYYQALLVAVGGLGAGLGKVLLFLAARALGKGIERRISSRAAENARYLVRRAGRSLFILVVLFAALPLPDDALYIPLGVAGYNTALFAVAVIVGKTILTLLVVALGAAAREFVSSTSNLLVSAAGIAVGTVIFMALIYKVNWPRIIEEYAHNGFIAAARAFAEELLGLITGLWARLTGRPPQGGQA